MFVVPPADLGERLDKLLSKHFPDHSRTYFQKLIDDGQVLVNGLPVKKHYKPEKDDHIEVEFQKPPLLDVIPEPIALDILYEDEHILAVNKPAGMVVHPGAGVTVGTFANGLLHHCAELDTSEFEPLRPGIVHRLDKDTSGVLIAAKTRLAHQKLSEQFSNRKVKKRYLAVCYGTPPEGLYSAPICRHRIKRTEMHVEEGGKEAISSFKVLAKKGELSLVDVEILTGRTHQIRVHLSSLRCPVLGDPVYGSEGINKKYKIHSQLLHASELTIIHPITGAALKITCSPPSTMKNFIELFH